MNERIRAIQVAKRPLKPIRSGLEYEPLMLLPVARFDRQAQFERHVESWRAVTEFDPREIMKRKPTPAQQLPDSFEAALWSGDLYHRTRLQPEPAQASNGRQIERRVSPVERNVQKGFGSGSRPAQRAWLTRAGRCAALRATRRCDFTTVPRPLAAASASLCFSRNSSTSREILRRVAAESLKTLAVAANVGHLLLKRILRRAIASHYLAHASVSSVSGRIQPSAKVQGTREPHPRAEASEVRSATAGGPERRVATLARSLTSPRSGVGPPPRHGPRSASSIPGSGARAGRRPAAGAAGRSGSTPSRGPGGTT
jgi:hypothetical protein